MWKYCILIYESNDYVIQLDEAGIQIGSDLSVARWFKNPEELHDYTKNRLKLKETEYGVIGYFESLSNKER